MTIFYLFSLLFVWMHLYYVSNINRLSNKLLITDIKNSSKLDLLYYILRVSYWFWIFLGLTVGIQVSWILLFFGSLKVVSYHISFRFYKFWNLVTIPLSIVAILIIFFEWLF